ncbi:hypothetical protein BSLG_004184 [Batrachochytrium salamandrivorans]|nr:hypothetical protein BSLG_004184 [Batrachochytrium salamandrivorans]
MEAEHLTGNTLPEPELNKQGADIRDILRNIIVQGNPARFKLDRAQIDSRKQFVLESRRGIEDMRSNVNNPGAARMGGASGMRESLLGSGKKRTDKYGRSEEEYKMSNQRFVEREQSQQQSLMREQDEQMDDVAVTVGNLREVARVMGDELDDQTRLLGEVEIQVDSTQNKLADETYAGFHPSQFRFKATILYCSACGYLGYLVGACD